jgi:CubicO group peptidase (beta-lactamase class C family)
MSLVEREAIDLDATVRTYLPDFRVADEEVSGAVTVRHLLTHMGGWFGDFFHDTGTTDDALARYVADMAELEQIAPLGRIYSYNNSGFCVAGRIIEVTTGQSFESAMRDLVFGPLGLTQAYYDPVAVMTHRFAVGHTVDSEVAQVARPWPLARGLFPAGGIVTSVTELLRYAEFHLGDGRAADGTRVLESETLRSMKTPQEKIGKDRAVGLAWRLTSVGEGLRVEHQGLTHGQAASLVLFADRGAAVAVLTNSENGASVAKHVVSQIMHDWLGIETAMPEPLASVGPEDSRLAEFSGFYTNPFTDIELGVLNGRLIGQKRTKLGFPTLETPVGPTPAPMALARCDDDRLLVVDGPGKGDLFDVIRDTSGAVGWIRVGGRLLKAVLPASTG